MRGEKCVVCGKDGERHHIVYKSQGGLDFPLNYVYLCDEHHRGINGPHKNRKVDLYYKLQMQKQLCSILTNEYYKIKDLIKLLQINQRQAKIMTRNFKLYKEGYSKKDIIKRIMGGAFYYKDMLKDYYDESLYSLLEERIK
ncbi:HNH endonuclease [Clostridium felsineum]|uniref:HNH endonuclease n=1 Tax=Clostridium felsineum TaxID=36839 RepID=UPI00214D819B|nr:HNH endonuclease signature motif containing protein [Clostridium felsineum]MCR3760124.1 HNH endonuclease [Clostridium felsineum]